MNEELISLSKQIKTLLQVGLTSIVSSGTFFEKARSIIPDETEYEQWVEQSVGEGVYMISNNVMRLNNLSESDMLTPVLLLPPTMLRALTTGLPTKDTKKHITSMGDQGGKGIEWHQSKNIELRKIIDERDKVIREITSQLAGLRKELNTSNKTNDDNDVQSIKEKILKAQAELANIKLEAQNKLAMIRKKEKDMAPKKHNEKYLFLLKTAFQQPFLSARTSGNIQLAFRCKIRSLLKMLLRLLSAILRTSSRRSEYNVRIFAD